ncbi:MAG: DUF3347 domain-containing protein [Bacteroidetes bacterium]|nr:DUF3347 domain-containing protein [Bacteroidota bacterium]
MKQVIKVVMPLAVTILIASCGNNGTSENKQEKDTAKHEGHDMSDKSSSTGKLSVKDDKLNAVYQHYIHLTTALINGNAAEAKIASNAIEVGIKEVPGGESIAANAAKITTASDIEAQRAAYSPLSNDFIALVKKSGVAGGELYVDYCPMALNDKGAYWLSANKEIRNPYFGDKMMNCGEVKETIK